MLITLTIVLLLLIIGGLVDRFSPLGVVNHAPWLMPHLQGFSIMYILNQIIPVPVDALFL